MNTAADNRMTTARTDANNPDDWITTAIRTYEARLLLYARSLTGNARAPDVVQETFSRLCRQSAGSLDGRLAEWLYTVCRNVATDVRRKDRRMRLATDEEFATRPGTSQDPAATAEATDAVAAIMRLLGALPENQREVVRLKFQHGLSYRQIAQVTQLSESNVGFLLHTALKHLRTSMSSDRREPR
jgi:RNA polymerase sigma-70 factor (ECF subfamily)